MTTLDKFLDGKLLIRQPEKGYRAGIDAVLLAAHVTPKPGDKVLDVGAGVGVVALCIAEKNPSAQIYGLERDSGIAAMAQENILTNSKSHHVKILQGDLQNPPVELMPNSFDHVVSNPPYFDYGRKASSQDQYKSDAKHAVLSIQDWVMGCLRMVKPRGYLTMIHRVDFLDEIIMACKSKQTSLTITPLQKDAKTPAKLVVLQVRKSVSSPLVLRASFILHKDDQNYTAEADAIFRGRDMSLL